MQGNAMRFLFSVALAFMLAACSNSDTYLASTGGDSPDQEWVWVPYDSDQLQISGRTSYGLDSAVVLSWSASTVTIGFVGTALEAKLWTNNHLYLDVLVDGEADPSNTLQFLQAEVGVTVMPVVADLPYGPHVVTLYKTSESSQGDWFFYGMRVKGKVDASLLPKVPERRIEFVGNSITCGQDVLNPEPGTDAGWAYESAYYSYAGQVARILGAEIHNICMSGRGFSINFDGSKAFLLPSVYENTGTVSLFAVPWDHSKWHPDLVVVNAGTNDFASGKLDSTLFMDAAVKFVGKIRSYHPQVKIVILDGPMLIGEEMQKCRRMLDRVKATLEGQGVKDLYRFSLEPKGETPFGIYYHPNREEAVMDAESLSAWIRSELGWK